MTIRISNKKKPTKETLIKRAIKDYLSVKGWFHFPILQGLGAYPGIPDIIAMKQQTVLSGRFTFCKVLFIEVKSEKGKLSEKQIEFQQIVEAQSGKYLIARSIDDLIKEGI